MNFLYEKQNTVYDGSQLRPRYNFLQWGLEGDSVVAFQGACQVAPQFMADGEDLRASEKICSDNMLHFLFEIFNVGLYGGGAFQRLFSSISRDYFAKKINEDVLRDGDDLFIQEKKLSISVAKATVSSVVIHLAFNVTQKGTPVPTCALEDFQLDPEQVAQDLGELFCNEVKALKRAAHLIL